MSMRCRAIGAMLFGSELRENQRAWMVKMSKLSLASGCKWAGRLASVRQPPREYRDLSSALLC